MIAVGVRDGFLCVLPGTCEIQCVYTAKHRLPSPEKGLAGFSSFPLFY